MIGQIAPITTYWRNIMMASRVLMALCKGDSFCFSCQRSA
jgi:hypothetical protein